MNKRESLPPVGAASLFAIFAVLCLAVFALLSLSTALSQQRLSQGVLDTGEAYYAADAACEEIFARLRAGEVPEDVTWDGEIYQWSVPVSDHQTLYAAVEKSDSGWTVLRWQTVAQPPAAQEKLDLWNGRNLEGTQ